MSLDIKVGDFVEVEGDYGSVTNAPWMQKVQKIENGIYYFNEGSEDRPYLVGYQFNEENFIRVGKNPYAKNVKVYVFSH